MCGLHGVAMADTNTHPTILHQSACRNQQPSAMRNQPAPNPDAAKRRLHGLDADGALRLGGPAFAAIWDRLPRYRWLSAIMRMPGLAQGTFQQTLDG